MRLFKILIISFILSSVALAAAKKPRKVTIVPKFSTERILTEILAYKSLEFRADLQIPTVILESKASIKQFQDEIELQWHMRPTMITNAYVVNYNKIYLTDDKAYYDKVGRCIDDSLAHELTHYIQVKYKGWSLDGDEGLEWDAVEVQTWFREKFCKID